MAYMYSIRKNELIVKEGDIVGNTFWLRDENRERKMTVYNSTTKQNDEPEDCVFLKFRDDKKAIELLIEKQTRYIKRKEEELERIKARIPHLQEKLEQV